MTRSWWGWGSVSDAVTGTEADRLEQRIRALLPTADLEAHVPPSIESFQLGAPRIQPPAALVGIASADHTDRIAHSHGQAFRDVVRALRGQLSAVPDLVMRPESEVQVSTILDWCTTSGVAVIPFGGGTSVVGGVEPRGLNDYPGCVSMDLGALNQVLEVDTVSRAARIQAGVLGPALEAQLRPHGYTLRHFPQSFEFSTLGGWLATRAGGHYATLYTHIDDLTESMRVITPQGICESRRLPGSGAGPSPDRLFLGSEGTLGVITEAWMRIQERPRWRARAAVNFADYTAGVHAVRMLSQSALFPTNCRLLDPIEAMINAGASTAVLVLGFESADHPVTTRMERAVEICRDLGGSLDDPVAYVDADGASSSGGAADVWRSSFLRMPYQRDALAARGMIAETFETACTWDRFADLREAVTDAAMDAMRQERIAGVITCRFTHVYPDGPAPYFGVYAGGVWGKTVEQWDQIKAAVSEAINDNSGTITHHHAVGRDHRPWYDRQRPEPFAAALRASKAALDPAGVLNPGVLIDPRDAP
ncbi:FAD-binding oxidoreductase [Mycobacterium sp. CBMA271]|uniref:FAD-binding oxidoreductase n=1 Tax=unclassified Mycobacteroides TaxID=2618759 RepID=UPI0012DE8CCF|nr:MULTISPECIES: FAD-binding oxidoreductase [unclassified Mycobacteroides]MUM15534.1 FAD-linked oxidase [Mycobacteroides sp. CBMA 326]MUM17329.1 FAD-linked oxidase [Mycobacteroides sp. CBMA 326]MUM21801.1 FAD-binding oxidoreductase [Mycobacteroides sp. CBMA 271]